MLIDEKNVLPFQPRFQRSMLRCEGSPVDYRCSERIKPEKDDRIIIKRYPNSFLETEPDAYLKSLQIQTLTVCGMMTHMCVDTTVRAAMDHGYQVKLAADACARMDLNLNGEVIPADTVHKAFIAALDGVSAAII